MMFRIFRAARLATFLIAAMAQAAGCAGPSARGWKAEMQKAQQRAAAGQPTEITVAGPGPHAGVYAFYNNPSPLCYAYVIPGDWVQGGEPGLFQSRDRRSTVGVSFWLERDLSRFDGGNLVERARTAITRSYEAKLSSPLTGVTLVPFVSARGGTWKWGGDDNPTLSLRLPTTLVLDVGDVGVFVITVLGTTDDQELARRIIERLRTTANPQCYWSELEVMMKQLIGEGRGT